MKTTETEIETEKDIVRSVRFKAAQWEGIKEYTGRHGIKGGIFLRNAALQAAGLDTEAKQLRKLAAAMDEAVPSPAKPAAKTPTKKKR